MLRKSKGSVGVIGLGIIGSRVVNNLRNAGYEVWLWNRSPRTEPNFLSSPRDVADSTTRIQFFVPDGPALLDAIDDMVLSLTPNHILMNHATIHPEEAREAERRVRQVGAKFLDAPFTGSRDAAEQGGLVFYVGGEPSTIEEVRPILEASSKEIIAIGKVGDASAAKIATNLITASIVQSLAEAMAIVDKEGISLERFSEALTSNASRSGTSDMKIASILAGDFQPRFSLKHMLKDIQLALRLSDEGNLELPLTAAAASAIMSGIQRGWGDDDLSAVARHYGLPGDHRVEAGSLPMPATHTGEVPDVAEKRKIFQSLFGKK